MGNIHIIVINRLYILYIYLHLYIGTRINYTLKVRIIIFNQNSIVHLLNIHNLDIIIYVKCTHSVL